MQQQIEELHNLSTTNPEFKAVILEAAEEADSFFVLLMQNLLDEDEAAKTINTIYQNIQNLLGANLQAGGGAADADSVIVHGTKITL